jgi:hypothetical protein
LSGDDEEDAAIEVINDDDSHVVEDVLARWMVLDVGKGPRAFVKSLTAILGTAAARLQRLIKSTKLRRSVPYSANN